MFPKEIRTNETVDVVIQMQHLARFTGKSNSTAAEPDYYLGGVRGKLLETAEWKETRFRQFGGGFKKIGEDASGSYVIEGRKLVYTFAPKKSGALTIGKDFFHNIPADCKFESAVIVVKD